MKVSSIHGKVGELPRSGKRHWLLAGFVLLSSSLASAQNYYAVLMGGANANADLQACASAIVAGGGGTCDARGFGAATETISDTVSVGASGKQVTFLFDPATTFVPAAANTTLFSLGAQSVVSGLHIDTTGFPAYSVPAIVIPGPTYAQDHFSLSNTIIVGNTASPSAGSACLALTVRNEDTGLSNIFGNLSQPGGDYDFLQRQLPAGPNPIFRPRPGFPMLNQIVTTAFVCGIPGDDFSSFPAGCDDHIPLRDVPFVQGPNP